MNGEDRIDEWEKRNNEEIVVCVLCLILSICCLAVVTIGFIEALAK